MKPDNVPGFSVGEVRVGTLHGSDKETPRCERVVAVGRGESSSAGLGVEQQMKVCPCSGYSVSAHEVADSGKFDA